MPFPAMRSAIVSGPTGVWLPSLLNRVSWPRTRNLKTLRLGQLSQWGTTLTGSCVLSGRLGRTWTKEPDVHRSRTQLFLNPKKPESDISPAHISTWIKKLVQDAHEHAGVEHLRLAKVSAHNFRKFSVSWVASNGAPFNEIMQAA